MKKARSLELRACLSLLSVYPPIRPPLDPHAHQAEPEAQVDVMLGRRSGETGQRELRLVQEVVCRNDQAEDLAQAEACRKAAAEADVLCVGQARIRRTAVIDERGAAAERQY